MDLDDLRDKTKEISDIVESALSEADTINRQDAEAVSAFEYLSSYYNYRSYNAEEFKSVSGIVALKNLRHIILISHKQKAIYHYNPSRLEQNSVKSINEGDFIGLVKVGEKRHIVKAIKE